MKILIKGLLGLIKGHYKQVLDSPLVFVLSKNYTYFINSNFFKVTSFYILKIWRSGALKVILMPVFNAYYWLNLWTYAHHPEYLGWVFLIFYILMTPIWYGIICSEIYGSHDDLSSEATKVNNSISWLEIWNYETTHSMLLNNKTESYDLYSKYRLTSFFNWHVIDNRVLTFFIFFLAIIV